MDKSIERRMMEKMGTVTQLPVIQHCIDFQNLTLGRTYRVNDQFTVSALPFLSVRVTVREFLLPSGTWVYGGFARVTNQQMAGGTGQEMWVNNVNLAFSYPKPLAYLSLSCRKCGKNNLVINGGMVNTSDLATLNGRTIRNVLVSVSQGARQGQLRVVFRGIMNNFVFNQRGVYTFAIGGDELAVDDICVIFAS